jgi:hypothetical protein
MLLRSRRVVRRAGAGAEAGGAISHRRGGAADAAAAAATPAAAPSVPPAPAAAPKPPPWVCVVCWEPQLARQRRRRMMAHTRSIHPPDLPCGHGCCAACLRAHVRAAAPPAALAVRGAVALAADVRCPGVTHVQDGGFPQRCQTLLPRALVLALLPRNARVEAPPAPALWWRSALRLRLGVKRCPWCGAASQLEEGCSSVRCYVCLRNWCFACGRGLSHSHEWHRGCSTSQLVDAVVDVLLALMLACACAAALVLLVRGARAARGFFAVVRVDDAQQPAGMPPLQR